MDTPILISGGPLPGFDPARVRSDGGVEDDAGHIYYERTEDYEAAVIARSSPAASDYLRAMWGVK